MVKRSDGQTDGCTEEPMDRRTEDGNMDEWTDGRINNRRTTLRWSDGQTDRRSTGRQTDGRRADRQTAAKGLRDKKAKRVKRKIEKAERVKNG